MNKKYIAFSVLVLPLVYTMYLLVFTGFFSKLNLYPFFKYEGKNRVRTIYFNTQKPQGWVKLKQVNQKIKWPIILSEDWAFYEHHGVDFRQVWKVLKESFLEGKLTRGASTISQQLVKNIYLGQERSLFRKFNELILVIFLEFFSSKDWILEQYLNIIELGKQVDGVGKASWFYFRTSQKNLSYKEGAFLAFLLPSPKKYSQSYFDQKLSDYAKERIEATLRKLVTAKVITEDEFMIELNKNFSWE